MHEDLANLKSSIYAKIDRVNQSRREIGNRSNSKHRDDRRGSKHSRRHRDSSSSGSSRSSSSGHSRNSRKGSKSKSILGRLKGDLAECDNLQLIKYSTVMKDRQSLESTNKEFASVVKDLKRKLEAEQDKNSELQTSFKLLEASTKRLTEDFEKTVTLCKEKDDTNKILKEQLAAEKNLLVEKKTKWKARIADLTQDIEKMKESNITLDNRASNFEQLAVNQDAMLNEEKEKIQSVESNLSMLKSQLDEARKEALANQEKTQAQETELAELTVRLQYEARAAIEMKSSIDQLKADLQEKDKTIEEIRKEAKKKREKLISTKDTEIGRITQENNELKGVLAKSEGRCAELEAALDDVKDKFEDTLRQLNIAEIKLTELVKEKELVMELKSCLSEKDRDIHQKRDYVTVVAVN